MSSQVCWFEQSGILVANVIIVSAWSDLGPGLGTCWDRGLGLGLWLDKKKKKEKKNRDKEEQDREAMMMEEIDEK